MAKKKVKTEDELNEKFDPRTKARFLSKEDLKSWIQLKESLSLNISKEQTNIICEIYHRTFIWRNHKKSKVEKIGNVWYPKEGNPSNAFKVLVGMISKIDVVYNYQTKK